MSIPKPIAPSPRFSRIRQDLCQAPLHLCMERARLITGYFKKLDDPAEPMVIRKARAFRHLMSNKSTMIFPHELIAGNVGSFRKSAVIQPELSGVFTSQDLLWIDRRKTTPFKISWPDRLKLMTGVLPYWAGRNMVVKAFWPRWRDLVRYAREQLWASSYLINEAAGVGHFLPGYEKVLKLGLSGLTGPLKDSADPLARAAIIASEGLAAFALGLAGEARRQADRTNDPERAAELLEMAGILKKVPLYPAETFHEAVQSLWLAHLAVCLEGINSAVSFGRIDQYLYPYYQKDLAAGRITPEKAAELLLCFSAKTTEHVFQISERSSMYHGGFLVVQAAIVGGVDRDGRDAVNELTHVFLQVMKQSGLRDPNYQVRIHSGSPVDYVQKAVETALAGNGVPALFSDEAVIASLTDLGYPLEEARDYGIVGCVEPALPGKSFFSTDAALFNLPLCLILALNGGRLWGESRVFGASTPEGAALGSMDDIMAAFKTQVEFLADRLINDLQTMERANRDYHPTPFSSMLIDGCLDSGLDLTAGGALYNSSGIQGVGVADVADSLAALEEVVFINGKHTLNQVISGLADNFRSDPRMRTRLKNASKFGNDLERPDAYARITVEIFKAALARRRSLRGGPYVPGFYSSTCHVGFGLYTGALPSGRPAGTPLAASLGSANGADRLGPTALLNSVAKIDPKLSPNGYALNLRFDPQTVAGERGRDIMTSLVTGFFQAGGMEMQFNVISAELLEDACRNPGKHPNLVVRVAGYCAYFDDLPQEVKREIIARNSLRV